MSVREFNGQFLLSVYGKTEVESGQEQFNACKSSLSKKFASERDYCMLLYITRVFWEKYIHIQSNFYY